MITQKNIIESIINGVIKVLNLVPLTDRLNAFTEKEYVEGIEKADKQYGDDVAINFVPERERLLLLQRTMNDNIENQGLEVSHEVRGELQRWKLNDENLSQAKTRIKQAMKKKKWNWKMKRIIRTEQNRANNAGAYDGAKQAEEAGLKIIKWVDVIMDSRTSNICKAEHVKYGTPEQAIPLDKEFIVKADNKTYRSQFPPFHPNCRTVLRTKRI